jgi:hypothetical protein
VAIRRRCSVGRSIRSLVIKPVAREFIFYIEQMRSRMPRGRCWHRRGSFELFIFDNGERLANVVDTGNAPLTKRCRSRLHGLPRCTMLAHLAEAATSSGTLPKRRVRVRQTRPTRVFLATSPQRIRLVRRCKFDHGIAPYSFTASINETARARSLRCRS